MAGIAMGGEEGSEEEEDMKLVIQAYEERTVSLSQLSEFLKKIGAGHADTLWKKGEVTIKEGTETTTYTLKGRS